MSALLTVIIPVYNEAATIEEILKRVWQAPIAKQVLVVDDGSTDGTTEILNSWRDRVTLFIHERNAGKGRAIRTALAHAVGEYTIIQDADLEYDPQDYQKLLEPLVNKQAEVVYGSRYLDKRQAWSLNRLGVGMLNWLVFWLYGKRLTDEATCYKVFFTKHLRQMELVSDGFEFCPEVTAKACRLGLRIAEIPIHYQARTMAEGKKIRMRHGWQAALALWRWRNWVPRQ